MLSIYELYNHLQLDIRCCFANLSFTCDPFPFIYLYMSTGFFFHHPIPKKHVPTWITCSRSSKRRLKSWCWQYSTTGRCWQVNLRMEVSRDSDWLLLYYVRWISGESHISGESPDLLGCFFCFQIQTNQKFTQKWKENYDQKGQDSEGISWEDEIISLCRVAWSSNGTSCRQWKLSNCPNTRASKNKFTLRTLCIFSARSMNIIYVIWICSAC